MGQSQFIVVLAFKLFSFLSYIFIVVASVAIVPCTTRIEKYTVGLNLPPQNVLCCVVCLDLREYQELGLTHMYRERLG